MRRIDIVYHLMVNAAHSMIGIGRTDDQGKAAFRRALGNGYHVDMRLTKSPKDARSDPGRLAYPNTDDGDNNYIVKRPYAVHIAPRQFRIHFRFHSRYDAG